MPNTFVKYDPDQIPNLTAFLPREHQIAEAVAEAMDCPEARLTADDIEVIFDVFKPEDKTNGFAVTITVEGNLLPSRLANLEERAQQLQDSCGACLADCVAPGSKVYVWPRLSHGVFKTFTIP